MINKILIIFFLFLFCGCSKKTPPSTAITETTKKEIQVIQKDIQKSTCDNKETLLLRLENISQSIENIDKSCKVEKLVLKEQNKRLKIILYFYVIITLGLFYIKRRYKL